MSLEEIFSVFVRLVLIFKEGKIRVFGYKKNIKMYINLYYYFINSLIGTFWKYKSPSPS